MVKDFLGFPPADSFLQRDVGKPARAPTTSDLWNPEKPVEALCDFLRLPFPWLEAFHLGVSLVFSLFWVVSIGTRPTRQRPPKRPIYFCQLPRDA